MPPLTQGSLPDDGDDEDDDDDDDDTAAPTTSVVGTSTGGETGGPGTTTTTTLPPGDTTAEPCAPASCDELDCGDIDDGCGGSIDCGGCSEGLTCQSHTCAAKQFATAHELWSTGEAAYPVRAVAWSVDGLRIATVGCPDFATDGEYVVWDSMAATPVWGYQYPPQAVTNLAWSPDGKQVVLGGHNSAPQIYSATSGDLVDELGGCHDGWIRGVAWRADGEQIASAGEASVNPGAKPEWCIWDANAHTKVHAQTHGDTYAVNDVAYTEDGKSLVAATDNVLWTFNASSYADGSYYDFNGWFEDPWSIQGVDWSPDGARLLMWTITAYVVIDVASGDVVAGDEFAAGVSEGTWSPSGAKYAVVLGDGKVRVYNLAPGELELQFAAHDVASSIDWSYHEQYLATGGESPRLAVWRLDY